MPPFSSLFKYIIVLIACLMTGNGSLMAESFTVDYDKAEYHLPDWMQAKAEPIVAGGLAVTSFVFSPDTPDRDLLVSVVFHEVEGGFLRVYWESPTTALSLAENLQEGINMPNKRQFLLKSSLIKNGGTLVFQSSRAESPIIKIKWEELISQTVAISAEAKETAVISAEAESLSANEVKGDVLLPENDRWNGLVIDAEITEKAERIDEAVLFEFALDQVPSLARLECQVNGLPIGQVFELWVNGSKAGNLSVHIPELTDTAYREDADEATSYCGWRKVVLMVPKELLKNGTNNLQFVLGDNQTGKIPLAVKSVKWQLRYPRVDVIEEEL
jgi:hypothetical protein